jgi:hypothetical protein
MSTLVLELTHLPIKWVSGSFLQGKKKRGVKLSTFLHTVLRLRMSGAILPLCSYAFISWTKAIYFRHVYLYAPWQTVNISFPSRLLASSPMACYSLEATLKQPFRPLISVSEVTLKQLFRPLIYVSEVTLKQLFTHSISISSTPSTFNILYYQSFEPHADAKC